MFILSQHLCQDHLQAVTQLLHLVLKPMAHKRELQHEDEAAMEYKLPSECSLFYFILFVA
jgi:hypothetical protein